MTIKECIDLVDAVKPNQYSIEDKVEWLSYLDGTIINDVMKTHEGYDDKYDEFAGYTPDRLSDALIVPSPYDRLYTAYIKMKIDEENGETARYNNSATMFNSYLSEFKKYYNKTHMPISIFARKNQTVKGNNLSVTEAQLEELKDELSHQLKEYFASAISHDKLYSAVVEYMAIHRAEFYGKDGENGKDGKDGYTPIKGIDYSDGANGRDGYTPRKGLDYFDGKDGYNPQKGIDYFDGKDGKTAYEYAIDGGYTGTEEEFAQKLAGSSSAKIGEVTLFANRWEGSGSLYSQDVYIHGVTANSQIDLTPSAEQLAIFYEKDITLVTENDGGVVKVYVIGQKLQNDYTVQVTITEVQNG